jgi:hypothetical protein
MTVADFFTILGLSALLLHELDAIQQQEWRFFFGWTGMSDTTAYRWFVAAHLPLILGLLAGLGLPVVQYGLAIFLILHAGAHTLLRNHPLIQFNGLFSRLWIYGGAVAGAVFLLNAMFKQG